VAHLRVGYVGDPAHRAGWAAAAEKLLEPLRAAVSTPLLGAVGELPCADMGTIHNDPTMPSAHATAGILLTALDLETIQAILGVAGPEMQVPLAIVEIRHLGGAFAAPPAQRDAVSGREADFGVWVSGAPMAPGFDPAVMSATAVAVRGVLDAVRPLPLQRLGSCSWSTGGVKINFCGSVNTPDKAARAWPAHIADKLAAIRRRYDPDTLFPYVPGSVRRPLTAE
jgi:hypothetical protein